VAGLFGAAYANLHDIYEQCDRGSRCAWVELTVDVISEEHTSQTYLMPPSVPRVPVFFLITPILTLYCIQP
jgi:hypothetical protein